MSKEADREFYARADEHLRIASGQLSGVPRGSVSASLMYACARFNAWLGASGRRTPEEVKAAYSETIEYFVAEYRKMLVRNLDDYVDNFEKYAPPSGADA